MTTIVKDALGQEHNPEWRAKPDHPDRRSVQSKNRALVVAGIQEAKRRRRATPDYDLSDRGAALVGRFEGVYLRPYNDPVGYCTVGVGHLLKYANCDGSEASLPSVQAAWDLLAEDMETKYIPALSFVLVPLNQNQVDALLSFIYNVGNGAFKSSTLLRKLNERDYGSVPSELMKWTKAGGVTLAGLVTRRKAEGELFMEAAQPLPRKRRRDEMPQVVAQPGESFSMQFKELPGKVTVSSAKEKFNPQTGQVEEANGANIRISVEFVELNKDMWVPGDRVVGGWQLPKDERGNQKGGVIQGFNKGPNVVNVFLNYDEPPA